MLAMARKSIFTTYFLWMFGGILGLHHFYLGRDFQALIWWMFPGGYLGLGFIRDLWRIPEYVKDANEDSSFMEKLTEQMRKHQIPPSSTFRYLGQIMLADSLGYLLLSAIPFELILQENIIIALRACLAPIGVAIGVYLVGNIGRQEGSFLSALKGAYIAAPIYFFIETPIALTSLASTSTFNKQWRRTPKPHRSAFKRILILGLCGTLYLTLWGSWFYFNCTMTHQETVKCKDAAKHFFKSPLWQEFVTVLGQIWRSLQENGWKEVWRQLIEAFDPVGEKNALRVLGLKQSATQQEITVRYRQLSREWHPDKNPNQREIAQEKFIEIQQAYETLSTIKSQRAAQNVRDQETENM